MEPTESTHEPVVAIVVAAGSGVRLGGEQPKALREIAGRSLVSWSVAAMAAGGADHVVVVIPAGLDSDFAAALTDTPIPLTLVVGGDTRQDSVSNGLSVAPEAGIVLVHDAARPLVPVSVVTRVIDAVRQGANAVVPVVPLVDSVRRVEADRSHVVDRADLRAVQTPQGFRMASLRQAYGSTSGSFTDDASLCEAAGYHVVLVDGAPESFKVTHPADVSCAEALAREAT